MVSERGALSSGRDRWSEVFRNMSREDHRTVEDSDNLKDRPPNSEQDQMAALRGDLAAGKEIFAPSPFFRVRKNIFELFP
jgi:hypothetical protein